MSEIERSSPQTNSDQPSGSADQPAKRRRNLPGMPDPGAEVIALSPETLMATNRFVCEVCNKGFPREQNLQLHRRGHNLPWKLRQREVGPRKRVYICPEVGCVHHQPSRALGDLTGIKKHFWRKHCQKSYRCERCSRAYALQSDLRAHTKTCANKQCATNSFSRRDASCGGVMPEGGDLSSVPAASTAASTSGGGLFDVYQSWFVQPSDPSSSLYTSHLIQPAAAALSATALLQKSAEVGSTSSSTWAAPPPSTSSTTLDFLGLGMEDDDGPSPGGFTAFLNAVADIPPSYGGRQTWPEPSNSKPSDHL